jgi:hypothetical protein
VGRKHLFWSNQVPVVFATLGAIELLGAGTYNAFAHPNSGYLPDFSFNHEWSTFDWESAGGLALVLVSLGYLAVHSWKHPHAKSYGYDIIEETEVVPPQPPPRKRRRKGRTGAQ